GRGVFFWGGELCGRHRARPPPRRSALARAHRRGDHVLTFLGNHWILDILDISIVSVIFYKLYMFIRSTRAISMFLGLLLITGCGLIAEILGLHGLSWIMGSLKTI